MSPRKKQKFLNFQDWSSAWNIFSAVLCEETGDASLPIRLAKHFQVVQSLANVNQDWRSYDIGFRQLLEAGLVGWGQIHQELLTEAKYRQSAPIPGAARPSRPLPPLPLQFLPLKQYPRGFCFSHHTKQACANRACSYDHRCFNCGNPHPFTTCRQPISRPFLQPRGRNSAFRASPKQSPIPPASKPSSGPPSNKRGGI